jgi:DNA-binding SARP family transcriptional activator
VRHGAIPDFRWRLAPTGHAWYGLSLLLHSIIGISADIGYPFTPEMEHMFIASTAVASALSRDTAPLTLQLLGVPALIHCGAPALLPRTQTRALLYRLGANLEPIPREELATLFWPDSDDNTARQNLRRLLSCTRGELPNPDALVTTSEFVALDPHIVWSDAHALEQLDHADNVHGWQTTVDLYGGSFLSGFYLRNNAEYELWQATVAERLRRRCLSALTKLVDHSIVSGEYQDAIKYARQYLEIDNTGETIHRQLIMVYARLGERDLALRQFEECTLALEQELGVEPLPETRAAYEQALRNETVLPVIAPMPSACYVLPSLDVPLVKRDDAMRELMGAFARHKRGGMVHITGEPGMGKSRLLQSFLAQQNALVLTGHCHSGSEMQAYHPIIEALRQSLACSHFGRGVAGIWLAELEQLLPELCTMYPGLLETRSVHGETRQAHLFEALVQVLLALGAKEQVILCVEDLQWADGATIAWLQYAFTRLRAGRVCVVVTSTGSAAERIEPLVSGLEREGQVTEIKLDCLDAGAVLAVIRAVKPPQPHDEVTAGRIHRATGGNTFFVLELVRELLHNNMLDTPPDPLPVPESVQKVIERRVDRVSAMARQVLEAAAVLNPELDFEVLHTTTGRDEQAFSDGLEELVDHHLLRHAEKGLRFEHSIVQATVYAGLKPWRRRMLHKRAAEALVRLGHRRGNHLHAAVAAHYVAAGNEQEAVRYYYEASIVAQNHVSARMAVDFAEHGLALVGPATVAQTAANLFDALGDGLALLGQLDRAQQAYRSALTLLAGEPTLQGANLAAKRAGAFVLQGRYSDAGECIQDAVYRLDHLSGRMVAGNYTPEWWQVCLDVRLEQLRICWYHEGPVAWQVLLSDLAPEVARHGLLRHRHALAEFLLQTELDGGGFRLHDSAVETRRQDLLTAVECGFPREVVIARIEYGFALLWARHLVEARDVLAAALQEARVLELKVLQLKVAVHLLVLDRLQGQVEHSTEVCEQVLELALTVGSPMYLGVAKAEQAWVLLRQGKQAAAADAAVEAIAAWGQQKFPMRWLALWVLLAVQVERDDIGEAVLSAWQILDASQQAPVRDVSESLALAIDCWTADDITGARVQLLATIALGQVHHYL